MTNDKKLYEKLSERRYKNNAVVPVENIIFTIEDQKGFKKTIGCSQSFVTFSGMPKQGKSLFVTSAIASAFTDHSIFGMKLAFPKNRERLCYIDTESSDYDYYKVLERMRLQMNVTQLPDNFDSFLFREDGFTDIMQMIEIYLNQNKECSILVIDGILDLIADFNNVEQSFNLVQWLKRISKIHDLLILCVLHLGKKDGNTLGHIGSFLDRKSQSVLKIEKNKERKTIDLTAQFLRSADDIDTISIVHDGKQWIRIDAGPESDQVQWSPDKIKLIDAILDKPKEYKEMLDDLCARIGKGSTTGKKIIKNWIETGSIVKDGKVYKTKTGHFIAPFSDK